MIELSVEHVLLFVVAAFLLYRLMGSCGCSYNNGFSVGAAGTRQLGECCTAIGQSPNRSTNCIEELECNVTEPGGLS